jgi:GNAT superfamily N-acetyltransferase
MKKSDLPQLAKVYTAAYQNFAIGEQWTAKTAIKLMAYWFAKQPDLAFVAEVNKKTVGGFISAIKPWWDGNHLSDGEIFVDPNYQKQGVATKLSIALYEKALKKYRALIFDAFTFKKTKFPLEWYLSQGFVENKDWILISAATKKILAKLEESNLKH